MAPTPLPATHTQGVLGGAPVLLYVFLNACLSAPGAPDRQLHLSGLVFLRQPGTPVSTTQLQQPEALSAWAFPEGRRQDMVLYLRRVCMHAWMQCPGVTSAPGRRGDACTQRGWPSGSKAGNSMRFKSLILVNAVDA